MKAFVLFIVDRPRGHFFVGWNAEGEPVWTDHIQAATRLSDDEAWIERNMLQRETGGTLSSRCVLSY